MPSSSPCLDQGHSIRLISASYEMADPPCLHVFRNVNYHSGDGIDSPKQSHHSLEPVPIRSEPYQREAPIDITPWIMMPLNSTDGMFFPMPREPLQEPLGNNEE